MNRTRGIIIAFILLLISTTAFAIAPEWKMIPKESSLSFTGTQNGAPVAGKFSKFTGTIYFDPITLKESKVTIIVDMTSLETGYSDLTNTLITPAWFAVNLFPKAKFEATNFKKIGDKTYQANGTLTIRNKAEPVTLTFSEVKSEQNKVLINGYTTIKRTLFDVGQGEWASTEAVKDEVKINFSVAASK